jgi:hypothetical protein
MSEVEDKFGLMFEFFLKNINKPFRGEFKRPRVNLDYEKTGEIFSYDVFIEINGDDYDGIEYETFLYEIKEIGDFLYRFFSDYSINKSGKLTNESGATSFVGVVLEQLRTNNDEVEFSSKWMIRVEPK